MYDVLFHYILDDGSYLNNVISYNDCLLSAMTFA